MRKCISTATGRACIVLITFVAVATGQADSRTGGKNQDWFVGIVTAKARVRVELKFDWTIERSAPGPMVYTFGDVVEGLPIDGAYDWIVTYMTEGDGGRVTTSGGAGGHTVELPVNPRELLDEPSEISGAVGDFVMERGQRWVVLVSIANASFSSASWRYIVHGNEKSAIVTKHQGVGSRLVMSADPNADGIGLATPFGAAGSTTQTRTTRTGIVGAVNTWNCIVCQGSWAAPLKRSGSWRLVDGVPVPNEPAHLAFAGPAGRWSWEWTGASYNGISGPDVLASVVPIGADWSYFSKVPPDEWRVGP